MKISGVGQLCIGHGSARIFSSKVSSRLGASKNLSSQAFGPGGPLYSIQRSRAITKIHIFVLPYQVVFFSLLVKQCAAVTAKLGVMSAPAHMKRASPFFNKTKRLTIQGNEPLGATAAPIESSSSQTIRPRRGSWLPF